MEINITRDENGKITGIKATHQDPNQPLSKDELETIQNLTVKLIEAEIKQENLLKSKRPHLSKDDRDLQRDLYYLRRQHG